MAQRDRPRIKRLIQFRLEHPDLLLYHDEPIYRDGELVGRTSSGMFSHTFGACLAMGYLTNDEGVTKDWIEEGSFEIEVATRRVPMRASLRPFYEAKIHS